MIHKNIKTDFSPEEVEPRIHETAYVHPMAVVIGNVTIGRNVMVSPFASVRADEGQPFYIGDDSNIQDGVIIHGLESWKDGTAVHENLVSVDGKKFSVYIGNRVSLAHQAQVHGPAKVGDNTFIGMQSLVFRSEIGEGCVIEPGCIIMGVRVSPGKYVSSGTVLKTQDAADRLPEVTPDYDLFDLNRDVIHVNTVLAEGYNKAGL